MKNRVFRFLVAVVLVCCLVVSWSPIKAKAVGTEQFVAVVIDEVGFYAQAGALSTGATVFYWVALGLGLIFTTAELIDVMNRYIEFSGETETTIYYYPDGSWSYGVDMGFVERVKTFLWNEGIVSYALPDNAVMNETMRNEFNSVAAHKYAVCWFWDGNMYFAYNDYGKMRIYNSSASGEAKYYLDRSDGGSFYRFYVRPDGSTYFTETITRDRVYATSWFWFGSADNKEIVSAYDLGYVSPLEFPISEGYQEWHANARPATNPDSDEEITVLPIPLNPSADPETQIGTLTQPDIWQGSIADPMPGTGTVPDGSIAETPWEAFKKWISEGWKTIIQAIPTPDSIAEAVGNVIKSIFVPDADFITEKWNDIRSRFEFADSITATGEVLVDILDGLDPEPPVIYIDLGAAEGSYNIGGEVPFVDLRWYARYKPTMDLIISAFLWLAFVWRLILKLPGIISGMPGEFVLMNLPVNLPHLGIGSGQRREELESGRNNRRLGDGH